MANLYSRRFKCLLRPFFALGNDPANLELGQCLQLQNLAPLEAFFCTSKGTVHLVNNQFLHSTVTYFSAPSGHFLH